jgi:NADPH:quinone reductase-like Zn-dependent oxidoreductase
MRAVVMREPGGPGVLEVQEVERPDPIPAEVLVRVAAAGINPVDFQTRQGGGMSVAIGDPPLILGWDVAGTVAEIGRGVTCFEPGDRVFGMPWFPRRAGAYAEYVTAPSREFARSPDALTDLAAGALPLAGLTAWQSLVETAEVGEGDRVLIHAAAGGVGHLAVQIAKAHGAHVIGTARAGKHDFLRELGVDEPIDYTARPFDQVISDVNVVLDSIGGEDHNLRSLATLREGGILIGIAGGMPPEVVMSARQQSKRATRILVKPDRCGLESLAALADAGDLEVHVEEIFPLERAAEAHELLQERRVSGKVVLSLER